MKFLAAEVPLPVVAQVVSAKSTPADAADKSGPAPVETLAASRSADQSAACDSTVQKRLLFVVRNWRSILAATGLGALLLAGCQHSTRKVALDKAHAQPQLDRQVRIYIRLATNHPRQKPPDAESGRRTAQALSEAFATYAKGVRVGKRFEEVPDALATARQANCQYLVSPTILRWEDHATEWTGRRDRIEMKVELIEVSSGDLLYAAVLQGRSRWMTDGGDAPEDLLAEPVNEFVGSLFRPLYVPSALR
ncbi:MAG: DUF4823 domain-containing protein [Chloroflexi bacterium]|nr:DUF4823 domain-containing protein [Chloroflexota bacterium]